MEHRTRRCGDHYTHKPLDHDTMFRSGPSPTHQQDFGRNYLPKTCFLFDCDCLFSRSSVSADCVATLIPRHLKRVASLQSCPERMVGLEHIELRHKRPSSIAAFARGPEKGLVHSVQVSESTESSRSRRYGREAAVQLARDVCRRGELFCQQWLWSDTDDFCCQDADVAA